MGAAARGVLSAAQRRFVESRRTATLATIGPDGSPRLVPICFALAPLTASETVLYTPLDEKPKAVADVHELARVRDIARRSDVTLLFDRWEEDWSQLGWLRVRGEAELIEPEGPSVSGHAAAVASLRARYPQYVSQAIHARPLIAVRLTSVTTWGATDEEARRRA